MKKKSFLVVGLGRFGSNVAESFYKNGHDVLAIDRDYARVQQAIDNKLVNNAIKVDAIDPASLQKIDLKSFDAAVIAIGTSIEDSILAAATLKDLGIKEIVAKASNTMHGKILDKVGVNQVVYPEAEMGGRVANQLMGISYLDEFPLNENYSISEVAIPKSFANKSILDCSIRSEFRLNVLAIRKSQGHFNISPSAESTFSQGDRVLVIGTHEDIEAFSKSE